MPWLRGLVCIIVSTRVTRLVKFSTKWRQFFDGQHVKYFITGHKLSCSCRRKRFAALHNFDKKCDKWATILGDFSQIHLWSPWSPPVAEETGALGREIESLQGIQRVVAFI
jgi:hypothetical protein